MISYDISDRTKIGTDGLKREHVTVVCPNAKEKVDGTMRCCPGYMMKSLWKGFNLG